MKRKNVIGAVTLNCYNCNHEFEHLVPGMTRIESSSASTGECPQCACEFELSLTRGRAGRSFVTKMQVVFKV